MIGGINPEDGDDDLADRIVALQHSSRLKISCPVLGKQSFKNLYDAIKYDENDCQVLFPALAVIWRLIIRRKMYVQSRCGSAFICRHISNLVELLDDIFSKWNELANWFGHSNIEDMSLPYLVFNRDTFWYELAPVHEFSWLNQRGSLTGNHLSTDDSDVAGYDFSDRTYDEHRVHRSIAEEFVNSIDDVARNTMNYMRSEDLTIPGEKYLV